MAAQDVVDGRSLADQLSVSPAGGYRKKSVRVCNDGGFALIMGCLEIMSGKSDIVLVTAWSKCSETDMNIVTNVQFDPFYLRPIGFNEILSLALQAAAYSNKYDVSAEDAALISLRNLSNALANPNAQIKINAKLSTVLNSKVLSTPLKELDMCTYNDGACAILLASEEIAKKLTDEIVWIHGFGWNTDGYYPGDRDFFRLPSLRRAADQAYKMAGIPCAKLDVIENSAKTSYHELLALEELRLCEEGKATNLLSQLSTTIDGDLPINPSGGIMTSNPYVASGLVRVAEVSLQILGKAGTRQVKGAKTGLAHGTSGPFMQNNCVVILGE